MFKCFILSLSILTAVTTASHAWTVNSSTDAFTDEPATKMCAFTSGRDEVCFTFAERANGTHLLVSVALNERSSDVFAHKRWPLLRIDRNEARSPEKLINLMGGLGEQFPAQHEHRWVAWRAQVAQQPSAWKNPGGMLYQLVKGKQMLIRLPLHGGYHKDVSLSLSGFTAAMKQVAPPTVSKVF